MKKIVETCKYVVRCMVYDEYSELEKKGILSIVSESDIKRVLLEYDSNKKIIMPPEEYFDEIDIIEYNDKSGYYIDIDLWYSTGQSDLTLQLDIKKDGKVLIEDIRVM